MGNICFWFLHKTKPVSEYRDFLTIEGLLKAKNKLGKEAAEIIDKVHNETQKIKPDHKLMLQNAFLFLEKVAVGYKKGAVLYLDNFEHILELNNFELIKDCLSLIDFRSKKISYFVSGNYASLLEKRLSGLGFKIIKVPYLDRKETRQLVEKITGKEKAAKISDEVFSLSSGHPFVVSRTCERYLQAGDAKKAFLIELLVKGNALYDYCHEVFHDSLSRARGQSLLKNILKVLSVMKQAKLSEIARKIYRSAPVTKSMLERLISVDLIRKDANKFSFRDDVLAKWVSLVFYGLEFDSAPDEKTLNKIVEVLNER